MEVHSGENDQQSSEVGKGRDTRENHRKLGEVQVIQYEEENVTEKGMRGRSGNTAREEVKEER